MIAVICSDEPGLTLLDNNDYNRNLIRKAVAELSEGNNYGKAWEELHTLMYQVHKERWITMNKLVDCTQVIYLQIPKTPIEDF